MRTRGDLVRLRAFQVEEKRRRMGQLEGMISEFKRMMVELNQEIAAEEERTGNTDPSHYAYSTYARSARKRHENLYTSSQELETQLHDIREEHEAAIAEWQKAKLLEERERNNMAEKTSLSALRA